MRRTWHFDWIPLIFPTTAQTAMQGQETAVCTVTRKRKTCRKQVRDWQTCKIYHLHLQHLLNSLCISFYFADLINCIIIIIHWKGHSCGLLIMNGSQYSQTRTLLSKTRTLPILCPYETSRTNNIVSRHEYWLDSVQYSKADNNLSSNWHYTSTSLTTST